MAKKKESGKLTAADMVDMMSRVRPRRTPGGPPGTDWGALQKGYEAGRLAEVGPKAADWDRVPRRKRELELEELAATRAYPELNYGERYMEDLGRGRSAGINPFSWVDPKKGWEENFTQYAAEVYGPDADPRYDVFLPREANPHGLASLRWKGVEPYLEPMKPPGRYPGKWRGDANEGVELSQRFMEGEKWTPARLPPEVLEQFERPVPEYYGPSPYPDRATDREKFMDMLSYFMESTGDSYPPPSKSHTRSQIEYMANWPKSISDWDDGSWGPDLSKKEVDAWVEDYLLSDIDWTGLKEDFLKKHGKKKK